MPVEREFLQDMLMKRARLARDFSETPDARGAVRTLEGENVHGHDANALFDDQTGTSVMGLARVGSMRMS